MKQTKFTQFSFQPFIQKALQHLQFTIPTEIQAEVIPLALDGVSVIGQSQTGTGKTHAYLLPIIEKIDPQEQRVQAVITAPTRELATQIHNEISEIVKFCAPENEISSRCFIGGTDKQRSIDRLRNQPHIVVGTPGRINDLVKEQALFVHQAEMLVIDEADLMLDMGFIEMVDQVAARMPKQLQILVFSATIPQRLQPFLKKYLENPTFVEINPQLPASENVEHLLLPLRHRNKIELTAQILQAFNPYLALVFTNTKSMADEVADQLIMLGLRVGRIHGDLTPRERRRMMKQIENLDYQYIVATDLASRGIDIEGVSHVINYELPSDLDFYVHRVGRSGRADLSGTALTIYDQADEDALNRLEKRGIKFKHVDLAKSELVEIEQRQQRKRRPRRTDELEILARAQVRKPKRVKPGYKKKMRAEIEKIKRRERRKQRRKR